MYLVLYETIYKKSQRQKERLSNTSNVTKERSFIVLERTTVKLINVKFYFSIRVNQYNID